MRKTTTLALALTLLGCGPTAPEPPPVEPLPEGNLLPEEVEGIVFGSPKACREDADCPSGVCYYGACGGLLTVDTRWMQEVVASTLATRAEAQPGLRERLVWHLARVLGRPRTESAFRARCVVGLERLGAAGPLRDALADLPEDVEGAAAMALARLGDPAGLDLTLALTEDDRPAVAAEALRALGASKGPDAEALRGLLRTLNPDLDGDLVRAALDGLAALGDRRAVAPLVAFLALAPDFLALRTAVTLRTLTGASLGADAQAWASWLAAHPQPAPPPYTLRAYRSEDDIGLPSP